MEKKDIEQGIVDRLSRTSGIDFELFLSKKKVVSIVIKDGNLDHFHSSRETGLALRVLNQGKLGFAYLFGPTPEGLARLADQALELAGQNDADVNYSFSPEPSLKSTDLELFDKSLERIPEKDKIGQVKEMDQSAIGYDPRVKKVGRAEYEEVTNHVSLMNSKGLHLEREETLCSMSIMAVAEDNGSSEMGMEFASTRFYHDLDPISTGRSAAKRSIQMLGGRPISTGKFPAVLENRVVIEMLGAWASSFFGENVYKGKSFLKDKMNETVASPNIHLIDNGLYPRGMGSSLFDDEGNPQAKTILVRNGTLVSYLFDGYWSRKTGSAATGNSFKAQIASPPTTSVSNLLLNPGKSSPDQLFRKMGEGFFITEVMGAHTIDPVSGEFSLGASGMWIQNGEAAFPVQGIAVSGTIYDLFSAVEDLGDDLRFLGRIGAPSLLIREMIISRQ